MQEQREEDKHRRDSGADVFTVMVVSICHYIYNITWDKSLVPYSQNKLVKKKLEKVSNLSANNRQAET